MKHVAITLLLAPLVAGCSVQNYAIGKVGDALASGGSVYESDEDLELVGDALPFSLKLVESLLAETPRHRGLLQTACKGFTTYSYVYVHNEADVIAERNLARARHLRNRSRKLYLRAHRYGLRALEVDYPGIERELFSAPSRAVARIDEKKHVPAVYWSAASLGLAIAVSKNDATLLARLPEVEALLNRAMELDPDWNAGALPEFRLVLAGARPGNYDADTTERDFEAASSLSEGKRAGLYVAYAEAVSIPNQDREQFGRLLERALAIDPDAHVENRLANLVAQRRARWLIGRTDDLILPLENP